MTNASVTNTFTSGTTAVASQVNQNFTDVLTYLNSTGVAAYQAGSVTAAALAADVNAAMREIFSCQIMDVGQGAGASGIMFPAVSSSTSASSVTLRSKEAFGTASAGHVCHKLANQLPIFYLDSTQYAVAGKTAKLRLDASMASSSQAPGWVGTGTPTLYALTVPTNTSANDGIDFTITSKLAASSGFNMATVSAVQSVNGVVDFTSGNIPTGLYTIGMPVTTGSGTFTPAGWFASDSFRLSVYYA